MCVVELGQNVAQTCNRAALMALMPALLAVYKCRRSARVCSALVCLDGFLAWFGLDVPDGFALVWWELCVRGFKGPTSSGSRFCFSMD